MSDNGSCYKSFAFRRTCRRLGLKHIRTKPYTPKTNGKAERFIQTSLRDGPTRRPIQTHVSEKPSYHSGSIATIGTGLTPGSMIKPLSADSV